MIRKMGLTGKLVQAEVSAYEHGLREPPLQVLLQYARTANILIEWLIDDQIDLPEAMPADPLPQWTLPKRSLASTRTRKR
jgi:transcriptional regulator with XRE-family HTH domain